jgi:hypothetical protein
MSLVSYIDHLRTKPVHVRRRIAFWTSAGTTALIFMFWVASYTALGTNAKNTAAQVADRFETPTQTLTASVGAFFDDVRGIFLKPKKIEYKPVEVYPGKN